MTDVQETTEAPVTEKADKPAKAAVQPRPCLCQSFEVAGDGEDEIFTTGCEQTTKSLFAQGHDARLVSFLVDGHFDGYQIRYVNNGTTTHLHAPEEAAAIASESLALKARAATANRQTKVDAKAAKDAEREQTKAAKQAEKEAKAAAKAQAAEDKAQAKAAKASAPKSVGAEVVAGSATGDTTPLTNGQVKIKVGRWEHNATIDSDGVATYIDGKGETQTVNRDGYRLLTEQA